MSSFKRIGINITLLQVAKEAYEKFIKLEKKIKSLESEGGEYYTEEWKGFTKKSFLYKNHEEISKCKSISEKQFIILIVFSISFLEAYIWEYSSIELGSTYTKKHIDKLDLISKWIIVPRLVTGKEIDKTSKVYEDLLELVKARNKIIHHKSKELILEEIVKKPPEEIGEKINGKRILILMIELIEELNSLDDNEYHRIYLGLLKKIP